MVRLQLQLMSTRVHYIFMCNISYQQHFSGAVIALLIKCNLTQDQNSNPGFQAKVCGSFQHIMKVKLKVNCSE